MKRTPYYAYLIAGELDNRTPGKVTGWMGFYQSGSKHLKVTFDLDGDFYDEDIRGKVIELRNTKPSDKRGKLGRKGLCMEGFSPVQQGMVGLITAGLPHGFWTEELAQEFMESNELNRWSGLEDDEWMEEWHECDELYRAHIKAKDPYYPYKDHPYIEWYANNGRVLLELDPSQLVILPDIPRKEKSPKGLLEDAKSRIQAFGSFMAGMVKSLSKENRNKG